MQQLLGAAYSPCYVLNVLALLALSLRKGGTDGTDVGPAIVINFVFLVATLTRGVFFPLAAIALLLCLLFASILAIVRITDSQMWANCKKEGLSLLYHALTVSHGLFVWDLIADAVPRA